MQTCKSVAVLFLLSLSTKDSFAQSSAAFQSLIYPRSVSSQGLGEQGVASRNPIDAMEYNPANLIYEEGLSLSMYKNPWEILSESFGSSFPLESFAATAKVNNVGNFGFEYTDKDYGTVEFSTPANTPEGYTSQEFHFYEQSFAGGYAIPVSDEFAAGVQLRYVREPYPQITIDHLLIGVGAEYRPEIFDNRLNVALSLMNFGTRINYPNYTDTVNGKAVTFSQTDSPPASLDVGIEGLPVTNDSYDVSIMAGVRKPLDKRGGAPDYVAESSFKALFNDWSDFPNDVTGQIGLGYVWHPIYLGSGLSYFQEMYVGYFSTGPKDFYNSFFTHGINVGLEGYGVKATIGYAGRWYNNNAGSYLAWDLPWETFQFAFSANRDLLGNCSGERSAGNTPAKIILSGGYSYNTVIGRMKRQSVSTAGDSLFLQPLGKASDSYSSYSGFSIEADFYLNSSTAIVSSLSYSRMKNTASLTIDTIYVPFPLRMESLSFASGFRYHPIEALHSLFVQANIGVIRLNPIENTSPKYFYKSFSDLSVGAVFHILDPKFVLVPNVGLKTIYMEAFGPANRLVAYNQINFGLNLGYEI